ncbi:MAG TPA: hypothetical protein VGL89_03360 [Candidatus Koribacter sp.]|jgi:hypothetical protein
MKQHFIAIWFFIGALLTFYGLLILGSGIYSVFYPPAVPVVMFHLHLEIWWGAGMLILGLVYLFRFHPRRNQSR